MKGWLFKTLVWLLFFMALWLSGLAWFIHQIPAPQTSSENIRTDAIVVLTGGGGRLEYGLQLLSDGRGKALFISGAGKAVSKNDIVRIAPADIRESIRRLPPGAITLGREAENTIGNAEETARWIAAHHYRSLQLVTADYHMPRALSELKATMPGITIVPAPVFPADFILNAWWLDHSSRLTMLSEYHKYLAGRFRHWLISVTPAP